MLSDMNATLAIQKFEQKIETLKARLLFLADMRPGSLSRQYNVCGKPGCRCKDPQNPKRHGPYYQLNYVYQGKKTSQFIRPADLAQVRAELATFKKFRRLTDQWVGLALERAKLKLKQEPKQG
jgi:hypothetical protein